MGVINITPNSFSDAISNLHHSAELIKKLNQFKKIPALIFDFGFESSAPMNSAITSHQERIRFDLFFEMIKEVDLGGQWISFDTYRPENYLYFEERFKSRYHDCGFIFNDVSGVLDAPLFDLLKSKKGQQDFYYLYCSTHIPSRDQTLSHMEFQREGNMLEMTATHFKNGFQKLAAIGMNQQLILDPGFGFSKSFEQNWDLIRHFDELVLSLKDAGIVCPWLIGLSKKSFLRKVQPASHDPFGDAEILHAKIIKEFIVKNSGHLIFRAHDPFLVESVYAGL